VSVPVLRPLGIHVRRTRSFNISIPYGRFCRTRGEIAESNTHIHKKIKLCDGHRPPRIHAIVRALCGASDAFSAGNKDDPKPQKTLPSTAIPQILKTEITFPQRAQILCFGERDPAFLHRISLAPCYTTESQNPSMAETRKTNDKKSRQSPISSPTRRLSHEPSDPDKNRAARHHDGFPL
jgi:hypothetical protein